MVSGFAVTGAALGMEKLVAQATNGAKFLKRHMFDVSSGRLKRTCYAGTGGTVEQRWGRGTGQTTKPFPWAILALFCPFNGLISGYPAVSTLLGPLTLFGNGPQDAWVWRVNQKKAREGCSLHSWGLSSEFLLSCTLSNPPCWGFLEDYAFVVRGLLDLYEASQESSWLEWALRLQDIQDKLFWDSRGGGYFCSEAELGTDLPLRLKDGQRWSWALGLGRAGHPRGRYLCSFSVNSSCGAAVFMSLFYVTLEVSWYSQTCFLVYK